jgi:hypothetical protein
MMLQQPSAPIIVRVVEEPLRGFGLGDVMIRAVGLTGALAIGALALGLAMALLLISYRKLKVRWWPPRDTEATQTLGLTPTDK